ncbi:leucyl aminopeptidase [Clostridium bowmanii]|uniref:leucyl aminopeptidase n=1 Tax=Clostridium bowmanii TaxID=132925 RepID=UPI001C0C9C83|nr:leucyl aminopeptidase [Clostridium bowmanii]MBU3189417.1 leucyl aminopeptidase [Clostridium bowmanii]MCA1074031.1 leucyl aminopeptidase [Clostridium bowmanii]
MIFQSKNIKSYNNEAQTKFITYFEDSQLDKGLALDKGLPLDKEIHSKIKFMLDSEDFDCKNGQLQIINLFRNESPRNVILVGVGKKEDFTLDRLRKNIAKAVKEAAKSKSKSIDINIENLVSLMNLDEIVRTISEAAVMADYKFDQYKSDKKASTLEEFNILYAQEDHLENISKGINEGVILGQANILTRTLVNEPANILGPIELAEAAKKAGVESGFQVEIFDEVAIKKLNMLAFLEVAKASVKPPRLIVMRYQGNPGSKEEIVGLVGKGLTYDSGGLSIKPTTGMVTMKSDMGGAAAVIGAMTAITKLKAKVNVIGVVASCENMIGGNSYRPGDIIGSMGGKTIEVINTDAEGRLTLVDAVNYIIEKEHATKVVDIATLTGAVISALGTTATGVVANNDFFFTRLEQASKICDEKVWRLPAFDEYKELIKSDVADLKNSGGRNAGSITAGLFIGEFVKDKPWLHLDIAGTSWAEKNSDYESKGGTGAGARLLYHLIKQLEK